MSKRIFEQEWVEERSQINNLIECNALCDLFEYVSDIRQDIKYIMKYDREIFNKLSKTTIETYYELVDKRYHQLYELCIVKDKDGSLTYFDRSMNNVKKEIYIKDGSKYKLKDKYFKPISKIAKSVFAAEDEISTIIEKLWIKKLSTIQISCGLCGFRIRRCQ